MTCTWTSSESRAQARSAVSAATPSRRASARQQRSPRDSPACRVFSHSNAAVSASSAIRGRMLIPNSSASSRMPFRFTPRARLFWTYSDQLTAEIADPLRSGSTACAPGSSLKTASSADESMTHAKPEAAGLNATQITLSLLCFAPRFLPSLGDEFVSEADASGNGRPEALAYTFEDGSWTLEHQLVLFRPCHQDVAWLDGQGLAQFGWDDHPALLTDPDPCARSRCHLNPLCHTQHMMPRLTSTRLSPPMSSCAYAASE